LKLPQGLRIGSSPITKSIGDRKSFGYDSETVNLVRKGVVRIHLAPPVAVFVFPYYLLERKYIMAKKEYGTRKKYHFIYKTTNTLSGRYYIGMHSTDDLNDGYLGSGTYLKRSINKHGKENHSVEILEFLNSREGLAAREKEIVSLQEIAKKECMNLKVGGKGGFSTEVQKRGSIAGNLEKTRLRKEDPAFRARFTKVMSECMKKQFLEGKRTSFNIGQWIGKKHTEATKLKMSKSASNKPPEQNSQFGTCWITNEVESKKIKKGDDITEGWRLGRIVNIVA